MRRLGTLFIFSIILFFSIAGSGISKTVEDENDNSEVSRAITPQQLDHYTSHAELGNILQEISTRYDKITELYDNLGSTYEDRIIWVMKISDEPTTNDANEPKVLFVGAHHGNELIGNEVALFIIQTLTSGYGHDPRITWLVDSAEIWVVPMLNPDGTEYTLNIESWRKNRSPNYISQVTPGPIDPKIYPTSYGTDLNRNYDIAWGDPGGSSPVAQRSSTYSGSEPFSEFETREMRDLILAHNFTAYMDYHSGTELILYPWGYTPDPTPDKLLFERIGQRFTEFTGFQTVQGYELYQTNGDAIDWIYSTTRTIAFTVELSDSFQPEPDVVEEIKNSQVQLPLYLIGISRSLEAGSQLVITAEEISNQSDLGPYMITAEVMGIPSVTDLEVRLYYKVDDGNYEVVSMKNSKEQPSTYTGSIPTQAPYSIVKYFIAVTDGRILVTSPNTPYELQFSIEPSPGSITTVDDIVAMVIMMVIVLGFFWGGFAYTSWLAIKAERRKLHEYYFGED